MDIVKALLEYNAQVDLQDKNGWSSLMEASLKGNINVVQVLLKNNAQVDLQENKGGVLFKVCC